MTKIERIPFDIPSLIRNKINLNQYFILYCILYNDKECLEDYVRTFGKFDNSLLLSLIESNYLFSIGDDKNPLYEELVPTESAYELLGLSKSDSWFEELWSIYPRVTPNGRMLKQISKDKAKKKYLKHVSKEQNHRNIISLLRKELLHRMIHNSTNYMQNLETWLNNESWNSFIESENPVKPSEQSDVE